jgi:hypothetical protein
MEKQGKYRLPGFDTRTVRPVANRWNDYAIPAANNNNNSNNVT